MTRHTTMLAAMLALAAGPAAAYKLLPAGTPVAVSKSRLTVTPPNDWNRLGTRPGRSAESWTLDGLSLNDLTFYGGIAEGETLFRETDKTEKPLPRFSATMLAPDITQLFEASYRIAQNTSLFQIDRIEPIAFAGYPGFLFTYNFVVQNEEVRRRGEAMGAVIGGKLYLISFEAPTIYYFERDLPAFRKIVTSARLGG